MKLNAMLGRVPLHIERKPVIQNQLIAKISFLLAHFMFFAPPKQPTAFHGKNRDLLHESWSRRTIIRQSVPCLIRDILRCSDILVMIEPKK
jgi:hypothetical protein